MTATHPNLSTQYDPALTEARWQQWWEEHQIFQANSGSGKPYCVVIPPPNVTGSLHMGHAFESALIDVLVRYHRMKGYNTLWLPGTDHASIAVQAILERQLKAEGKTRIDLGRTEFMRRAWEWKAESGSTIVNQLRRLGVSVDWSRERFTLDAGLSKAVLAAFVQLYEAGLIYRGKYLVYWCPATQSAVSDLEVENQEVEGHLWHFCYPLTQGAGSVEVATTRPETMLGDTAVAVHPDDTRYQHLIGQTVTLPILNREIPIIGDQWVDPAFGTGCVKVTPAHDPNDFEIGQRHELPMINILNKDGSLNENAGPFQGQDRFVARRNVVERLEAEGFLVKVEDYRHTVPYSDRGKVPVEPLLSTQWFVKIRPLADRTLEFLDQKQQPAFVPQRWTKVYRDWLVSLKDWCISRQLWWGHQIPAWYAVSQTGGEITDQTPFLVAATHAEAQAQAEVKFGPNVQLQQDPDVLDTWFSSGLWPFSTLGWPEQTEDLAFYYPTTTLVTGFDIIFFWVARMTMMGIYFTGQMPFKTVYIHGLVRDENNKKMSKSANNGIDPLVLIKKYGTDALRYTLIREVAGAGQDIRLEYDRKKAESPTVEASRNFANKLWNASRFVMLNLDGLTPEQLGQPRIEALELSDRWILSRFYQVAHQTSNWIDNYGLGEAAKGLYEFIWGDFCDWYIELVKPRLQGSEVCRELPRGVPASDHLREATSKQAAQQTLAYVLEGTLKLLHPFMPHVTEEIWHTLTQVGDEQSLALQAYPEADPELINPELEQQFELIIGTIRTVRNLRAEAGIKPGVKIQTILQSESDRDRQTLTAGQSYIQGLARVEKLTIAGTQPPLPTEKQVSTSFLSRNKQTRISVGLILTAVILLVLAQAVLTTLSYIPLLLSICELIGFGYSTWFVIRYLLGAAERQGLSEEVQVLKEKIVGKGLPDSHSQSQYPDKSQQQMFAGVVGTVQVLIPLAGVVDVEALRTKLEKDLSKVETDIKSFSGRLNNSGFVDKAPPEVVQGARNTLAEAEKQAEILRDRLDQIR